VKGAMSPAKIWEELKLDQVKDRNIGMLGTCALEKDRMKEILDWLARNTGDVKEKRLQKPEEKTQDAQEEPEKTLLETWLEQEDEPDDEFLDKLTNYTLDSWDHRTHLRLGWLYLTRYGRREGMKLIFSGIKNFIANSPRTKKTTFHETMTYFW
jgi:hypothetical protein